MFATAHQLSLSWARLFQLTHYQFVALNIHCNIITFYAYKFQLMAILFRFPPKYPHAFHFSPVRATCPAHLILLDMITLISSSLCSFLHSPVTSLPLRPKYLPQHHILRQAVPPWTWETKLPTRYNNASQRHCWHVAGVSHHMWRKAHKSLSGVLFALLTHLHTYKHSTLSSQSNNYNTIITLF